MTTAQQLKVYDAPGVARFLGRSEAWVRYSFADGLLPTEVVISERRPALTYATLKKIAPTLRYRTRQLN
jgi:hypothetical protein